MVVDCTVVVVVGSTEEVVVVTGAPVMVNAVGQVTISVPVVTVTSRAPTVAPGSMVILATASVVEFTFVLLTVMPVPLKDATVTPSAKLVSTPVIVTSRVVPSSADAGAMLAQSGAGVVTKILSTAIGSVIEDTTHQSALIPPDTLLSSVAVIFNPPS